MSNFILKFISLYLLVNVENARAYADPGTGSLLLQLIAAGLFGALYYLRNFFSFVKDAGLRRFRNRDASD